MISRRSLPLAVALAGVALAAAGCSPPSREPSVEPAGPPPHVVFIVLDNVRADRLSLCGYERPTSPFLADVCGRPRAACSCGAQAPSSWTVPSHASYFTGVEVPQHGAGIGVLASDDEGATEIGVGIATRPLGDEHPTLAERFKERGYQTMSVSGNPLISPPSGLTRGFDIEHHGRDFGKLHGAPFFRRLEQMLAERGSDAPLFLFLNIIDAHRPWFGIPVDKHDWLPPRPYLGFQQEPGEPNETRRRFITGEMPADEAADMLAHLNDVFDYAVWRADETLLNTFRVLREAGLFAGAFRLVITSDHGEHLGEHGLLGHAGPYLWEEITRVPVVWWSSETALELPERMAALAVHDLLLEGRYKRRPLRAAAFASDVWPRWYGPEFGAHHAAALWLDGAKSVHHDGAALRYDLDADPAELDPAPETEPLRLDQLDAMLAALDAAATGEPPSDEMLELLKSLGYM